MSSRAIFVGALAPSRLEAGDAFSPAGQHVQEVVIEVLREIHGRERFGVVSMPPYSVRSKRSPRWYPVRRCGAIRHLSCVNIPLIKPLWFALQLLAELLSDRPRRVYVWNCNFWNSIALGIYRVISAGECRVVLLLQDSLSPSWTLVGAQRALDELALRLARLHADLLLAVTEKLAVKAGGRLPTLICPGGVEVKDEDLIDVARPNHSRFAFGGRLEDYNGPIDIVQAWPASGEAGILDVYGAGSRLEDVMSTAQGNPFVRVHGFVDREAFVASARSSLGLIVLRYSRGIDQDLFFPSKFLEACLLPVEVICNRFRNIPEDVAPYCHFVKDDLSDLPDVLSQVIGNRSPANISARQSIVRENYSWRSHLRALDEMVSSLERK